MKPFVRMKLLVKYEIEEEVNAQSMPCQCQGATKTQLAPVCPSPSLASDSEPLSDCRGGITYLPSSPSQCLLFINDKRTL